MTLAERIRQAQLKDVVEMGAIYAAAAAGVSAAEACSQVVGGSFNLSPEAVEGIRAGGSQPRRLIVRSPLLRGRESVRQYLADLRG